MVVAGNELDLEIKESDLFSTGTFRAQGEHRCVNGLQSVLMTFTYEEFHYLGSTATYYYQSVTKKINKIK